MTTEVEKVNQKSQKIAQCSTSVWECTDQKRIIKTCNTFDVARFGTVAYKPQCLKCGRIGQARTSVPNFPKYQIVGLEEAKRYESDLREQRRQLSIEWQQAFETDRKREEYFWRAKYVAHLKSDYWARLRLKVLNRDGHLCQCCLSERATEVHHLTYKRLGRESAFDLKSVCRGCHERLHETDAGKNSQQRP